MRGVHDRRTETTVDADGDFHGNNVSLKFRNQFSGSKLPLVENVYVDLIVHR